MTVSQMKNILDKWHGTDDAIVICYKDEGIDIRDDKGNSLLILMSMSDFDPPCAREMGDDVGEPTERCFE